MKTYNLNKNEEKVLQSIKRMVSKGEHFRLVDVADKNFVSTTYVIKVCQKMGYKGFGELVFALKHTSKANNELSSHHSFADLSDRIYTLIELYKNKTVFIHGIGYSSLIAEYFVRKLTEYQIFALHLSPRDTKVNIEDYLIIFISKSGETDDNIEISKNISESCHQVLLTSAIDSSLSRSVDITYKVENENYDDFSYIDSFDSDCLLLIEHIMKRFNIE